MAFLDKTPDEFAEVISNYFTPAVPIKSIQHLKGREKWISQALSALRSKGRHLFVFGDRGIGKTSLAQTVSFLQNSSTIAPVFIGCDEEIKFSAILKDILDHVLSKADRFKISEIESTFKLGPFSTKLKAILEKGGDIKIDSINSAVRILDYVAKLSDNKLIILIDEFDRIAENERKHFSDLVKQVSDQGVGVKFVFCGVARSLDEFVGFHQSAGRYVYSLHLDKISIESRRKIIGEAYDFLNVKIDGEMLTRIAQISDGFPYFIHLIGEQILYQLYHDAHNSFNLSEEVIECEVTRKHYDTGLQSSVSASEAFLKESYEKAVMKGSADYELVLWAVADTPTLTRRAVKIYEESYLFLCEQCPDQEQLGLERFRARLATLRKSHGNILRTVKPGWYEFSENMVRGYVRMRAMAAGINLSPDRHR